MGNDEKTTCNQEAMLGFYLMLSDMVINLNEAYQKVCEAKMTFETCYSGDAQKEIELFLSSLPAHINRLAIFYSKLMEFIYATAESLLQNDIKMAQNMEG